jgi:PEP-CTERM motif-containing protein
VEIKLKRAFLRALGLSCIFMTTGILQATTLWNNGTVSTNSTNAQCDGLCGTTSGPTYTVFDNFFVGASIVSGFDYSDFFINSPTSQYTSTQWSIWRGDPLTGGTLVASGNTVASLSTPSCDPINSKICLVQFTVTGLSVKLDGGTYYLGTSSIETSGTTTMRALASGNGLLTNFENSTGNLAPGNPTPVGSTWQTPPGSISQTYFGSDSAFDISGFATPEPGTLTLMGFAIAGLCLVIRRRSAA